MKLFCFFLVFFYLMSCSGRLTNLPGRVPRDSNRAEMILSMFDNALSILFFFSVFCFLFLFFKMCFFSVSLKEFLICELNKYPFHILKLKYLFVCFQICFKDCQEVCFT